MPDGKESKMLWGTIGSVCLGGVGFFSMLIAAELNGKNGALEKENFALRKENTETRLFWRNYWLDQERRGNVKPEEIVR